jgi:hypothetical protein
VLGWMLCGVLFLIADAAESTIHVSDYAALAGLYVERVLAWWGVGRWGAKLRGRRLLGWTVGGTVLNAAFDVAVVAGLLGGWISAAVVLVFVGLFIWLIEDPGRRQELQDQFFAVPLCRQCEYNLTGNLSGICPECGTPIARD